MAARSPFGPIENRGGLPRAIDRVMHLPSMKVVILMRHGHAAEASPDHDRPLTDEGRTAVRRAAMRLRDLLANELDQPITIISSTATRAKQTGTVVAELLHQNPPRESSELYLAPAQTYTQLVHGSERRVMIVVGHNPGVSEAASRLLGRRVGFAPADFAVVRSES